ncbi:hypothetical protein HMPREF0658_2336, partial [Hoylesella marshii DSM 16973 = JCM 13450]
MIQRMNTDRKTHEIDVVGIFKQILREKKPLAWCVGIMMVLGVVVALNTEKTYTANVVLAPEITGMGMSQSLGDLASMVGVNLGSSGSSTDAIYPDIYPDVFASNDFIIPLFQVPVMLKDSTSSKTYYIHLLKDHKVPFWKYPALWINKL